MAESPQTPPPDDTPRQTPEGLRRTLGELSERRWNEAISYHKAVEYALDGKLSREARDEIATMCMQLVLAECYKRMGDRLHEEMELPGSRSRDEEPPTSGP